MEIEVIEKRKVKRIKKDESEREIPIIYRAQKMLSEQKRVWTNNHTQI